MLRQPTLLRTCAVWHTPSMQAQGEEPPEDVLLVDAVPHDWLFPRCQAVIHHGGAGTTAAGLLASCPTTVVPFFGDQSFWCAPGSLVRGSGLLINGPSPLHKTQAQAKGRRHCAQASPLYSVALGVEAGTLLPCLACG